MFPDCRGITRTVLSVTAVLLLLLLLHAAISPAVAGSKRSGGRDRPFEQRSVFELDPWAAQEQSWPDLWRKWSPKLPPMPSPLAVGDLDRDGHADIVIGEISIGGSLHLLRGNGTAEFSDAELIFEPDTSGSSALIGIVPTDIDGDLDLDLYLVRFGRNIMLLNDGTGRFASFEVVNGSSLGLEDAGMGIAAIFFDADQDDDLDLYVANIAENSEPMRGGANRFYRNLGEGFADETEESGLGETGFTASLSAVDLQLDGRLDLVVTNYLGPTNIYVNFGRGRFARAESNSSSVANLGMDTADLDSDLRPDLLITAIGHPGDYLESNHVRLSSAGGFNHGGALGFNRFMMTSCPHFCDFDNDGLVDLALGRTILKESTSTERQFAMWVGEGTNDAGRTVPVFRADPETESIVGRQSVEWMLLRSSGSGWMDRVSLGPIDLFREPTRAITWLDADEDGDADLLVSEAGGDLDLFINREADGSRGLSVTVRTERPNRLGVGTQLFLRTSEGVQVRTVEPGSCDMQAADGKVCFGLGEGMPVDLALLWPHGGWQTEGLASGGKETALAIEVSEDSEKTKSDPPRWLADYLNDPAESPSSKILEMERALLDDPTDFELGWRYRTACRATGNRERPIAFFSGMIRRPAQFAWSLQRFLSYIDAMGEERIDGERLAMLAGLSIYELERLRVLYPDTWIVEHLLGVDLLYWPPLFSQLDEAIAALKRCIDLQEGRNAAHLAESYLGLGDAYGMKGDPASAQKAWRDGLLRFPGNTDLKERLEIPAGEIEEICRRKRDIKKMPEARIAWLEDEVPHSPLKEERRRVAESRSIIADVAGSSVTKWNWLNAGETLNQRMAWTNHAAQLYEDCLHSLQGRVMEEAVDHLLKGIAHLERGFTAEHLRIADRELDSFCQEVLTNPPQNQARSGGSAESEAQRLLMLGLIGRGDAAMKLGDWRQGARLYALAREISGGYYGHRIRDLLPLSSDPAELWSHRFRQFSPCSKK